MTKSQQAILIINHFSKGILAPIMNLILLGKGATLQTLPLFLGVYSTVALCSELPSGVSADLFGRKRVYLLSCGFEILALVLLLFGENVFWLVSAMVFMGLGRSFASGSIDALFIDDSISMYGKDILPKVTTQMAILEGSGLALGSILGGFIANSSHTFGINIRLRLIMTIILLGLCALFVNPQASEKTSEHKSLRLHLKQGKELLLSRSEFSCLLMGFVLFGMLLAAVETYWQPAFLAISPENSTWMLGIITSLGFSTVILGSWLTKRLLERDRNWWRLYTYGRLIFGVCIINFALQKNAFGYILSYGFLYVLLGANSVLDSSILNRISPSNMRASALSLSSLAVQLGYLSASLISSILVTHIDISGLWIMVGVFMCGFGLSIGLVTQRNQKKAKSRSH